MAKFYGSIGYAITSETSPGVWQEQITERNYYGDVIRNLSKIQSGENLNDNLNVDNKISIVSDPYAYENFQSMRYVKWMGALWKITSVEVQRPRLILSVGGVYNEQQTT
jgi:hypothetical protein